jgi:hypothetical protein
VAKAVVKAAAVVGLDQQEPGKQAVERKSKALLQKALDSCTGTT